MATKAPPAQKVTAGRDAQNVGSPNQTYVWSLE
jgi:hypothetical protein